MFAKSYRKTLLESSIAFFLATFCIAFFFSHLQADWLITGIIMAVLYFIVITICTARIIKPLPVAAVMILIPIIPLAALIFIVSFIHLLQLF